MGDGVAERLLGGGDGASAKVDDAVEQRDCGPRGRVGVGAGGVDGLAAGGQIPGPQLGLGEAVAGFGLHLRRSDGVGDLDRLPVMIDRGLPLPEIGEAAAEFVYAVGFKSPVADLPVDGQGLLVQVDRPVGLPEVGVADAEVAQSAGFASPVAGLPVDGQGLLVQVDRPVGLPEFGVAVAEVAQGCGFACPVADLPVRWSGLARAGRSPGGSAQGRRSRCRGCPERLLRLPGCRSTGGQSACSSSSIARWVCPSRCDQGDGFASRSPISRTRVRACSCSSIARRWSPSRSWHWPRRITLAARAEGSVTWSCRRVCRSMV